MDSAMKSVTFVFQKITQNCSKQIIGQRIDIQILPLRILIQVFKETEINTVLRICFTLQNKIGTL